MADLIPKNTDEEIERYMEADMIRRARIPMEGNAALKFEADPITKRENAYFPLSSGGYVKIGERAVKPKDTAKTDVLAAARDIQNDARGPISEVMGGAEGPTMADYEAAGFTEAEVLAFQAQEEARMLAQPGMQVPVQLTPEQIQYGVDVGAPTIALRATTFRDRVRDVAYSGLGEFIDDPNQLRFWSDYLTDVADIMVPGVGGAISTDEGARLFNQGVEQGNAIDMLIGAGLTTLGVAEMVPLVRSLSGPARQALTEGLSPAAKNLLADSIGASRAIAQGDKDMLMEIFQPAGTPRSLGAAAPEGAKIKPQMGEAFDDWIDRIYAPENRGPQNVVQDENVVFRAMSPQEAEAGEGAGVFRDLSGQPLYVANDPERYIGGGAYGGKRQGRIYEFDVTGLASEVRQGGVGIQERAISEIPTDRVRRVWEWNPETKAHELIIDNTQPRSLGAAETMSFQDALRQQYPDVTIDISGTAERGYELGRIVIPEGQRESGLGTKVMEDMIRMADEQGARISLTPDTSFGGTSVSRLRDFYKRFGFVENKGKNKDFSTRNTMYRDPQPLREGQ